VSIYDPDLTGRTKHDLAIARIRNFCTGKKTLVAFSGGKDSQCCYHLCEEAGVPFAAQYSITRFEPPELLRFVRENYPGATFRRAYRKTLRAEIIESGLPNRWARWCCEAKHVKTEGFDITVVGVRAEESARRAKNWREFGYKPDRTAYVCPIIGWTTEDVWEYLALRGVPHCSLYDEGWTRIGCVCCPLSSPAKMQRDAARWPKTAAMLKDAARGFVERMRSRGFVTARGKPCADWCKSADPAEEFWRRWILSGQTQKPIDAAPKDDDAPCLFAGTGFSESDGEENQTAE
jgi:phosphoadenosine phosphosulfate reductase